MATNLSLKIDVTKILKEKLYKGEKGTYLDCVIIMRDEPDEYGNNGMIVQSWKDKPRDEKGAILGNAKYIAKKQEPAPAAQPSNDLPDLPF